MEPVIYVGPTFKGSRLNQFMVFTDGAPSPERDEPVFKNLFVPLDRLEEAMQELQTKGSKLNVFYNNAIKSYEGVK